MTDISAFGRERHAVCVLGQECAKKLTPRCKRSLVIHRIKVDWKIDPVMPTCTEQSLLDIWHCLRFYASTLPDTEFQPF